MPRFFLHCVITALMLLGVPSAWSCAICAPAEAQNTLSHQIWAAQSVVLARPGQPGQGSSVLAVLKGIAPSAVPAQAGMAEGVMPKVAPDEAQLWVLSAGSQSWRLAGVVPLGRLPWLQSFARLGRAADTTTAGWPGRLAFLVKSLEDPNGLIAQATYEEIAVAPFGAMRTLKPMLDREALERWFARPGLAARRPLYALLLGVAGNELTAQGLQAELLSRKSGLASADLSAMLAALIELRGEVALDWIERHYLADPARPDSDLQAVLLALSVQGSDGQRISRERIVATYASWVRQQRSRAGLVASDLAAWGRWEFGSQFAGILQSGEALSFASRYAMVLYLMRSPRPEARQALEALKASGSL